MPRAITGRSPLRILFDGGWWARGPVSNRQVQRELVFTWAREYPEDALVVAVPRDAAALASQELAGSARVITTRLRPHGLAAILDLSIAALRLRPDITISHNFTPLLGRSAVFIQDFLFLTDPEWFTARERLYFALMPLTVGRADLVLTSSESEAARIVRTSAARSATPVGLGLSRDFEAAAPRRPAGLGELDGFLLTVGRLNVRKNLATTIDAAVRSGVLSPRFPLLVVGEASGRGTGLPESFRAASEDGSVRLLGRVSDDELRWLYEQTDGFLFLTLDEGFGLPTLEALATRAPALVSDIPVFREIVGTRARRVDPRDPEAIALAVRDLVDRPPPREDPAPVLEHYSWEAVVRRTRDAVVRAAR